MLDYLHRTPGVRDVVVSGGRGLGEAEKYQMIEDLAKLLKVGQKNGDGAMFAELYKQDESKALDYLRNDLSLTRAVAERLLA